jgi:hypothetical protein
VSRTYYSADTQSFLADGADKVRGILTTASSFAIEPTQRDAWVFQIRLLLSLAVNWPHSTTVHFEYSIPRLGKRIDTVIEDRGVVLVLEFKVGAAAFLANDIDQVWDYALDLKNFHETSRDRIVIPVLLATEAIPPSPFVLLPDADGLTRPVLANSQSVESVIDAGWALRTSTAGPSFWVEGRYSPSPTIVEAALALYRGHTVADISRSDAGATNLSRTAGMVADVIESSRREHRKSICFVTGVPGAGKTLVGLDVATRNTDSADGAHAVFLSGNGPLVAVLREALTRDRVAMAREKGVRITKGSVRSQVQLFVQNVHHFRDDCLSDHKPPIEHVVLFDEAQRAWDVKQTANFMRRKKGKPDFDRSEPDFLISCMDRHPDWAVIVCLVGGGQEINTGEGGIAGWIDALALRYGDWAVHISDRLVDAEYGAGSSVAALRDRKNVTFDSALHLAVSMRSFRAEHVSEFVKHLLDRNCTAAQSLFRDLADRYPIVLSRDLQVAKRWVRGQARGSERFGMVASSQAQRLKPHAINVSAPLDPVHWFLDPKSDVRSSYYLEDAATEFHVQGLELDWACVTWDADFRYGPNGWDERSFVGDKWNRINKPERKRYLMNAYRVLLTRARQGMAIFVPDGDLMDPTRSPEFYDGTYEYLRSLGLPVLNNDAKVIFS